MVNEDRIEWATSVLRSACVEGPLAIDSRPLLQTVAGMVPDLVVTRHPLGFIHVDLTPFAQLGSDEQLRLHIWTEESARHTDELGLIHDHVWEGKSFMLAGSLTNRLLRATRSPSGRSMLSEVAHMDGEQFVEVIDKDLALKLIDLKRCDEGNWYFLPRRVIHETRINRYPTATLVLAVKFAAGRPRVLTEVHPNPGARTRPNVPPEVTLSALTEVLVSIG